MYACWGKEPITVGGDLGYFRRMRRYALEVKMFLYPLFQLGSLSLEYYVGMIPEVIVLYK